ncbi:MAG: heavy metal-binding domain-containing protein [Gammaproteobacteria bacterium]|nr:heavy metal-binding domain-containing protein [Gammaproteobacteria bacterium]
MGANAVIGVDLDYSEFSGGGKSTLFLAASGTAVIADTQNAQSQHAPQSCRQENG